MQKLIIYQASAGSGKTWRLAYDYVRLLFTDPLLYRHILAVTFTHKATGEMKSRILRELQLLALGHDSSYTNHLEKDLGLSADGIRTRAQLILQLLLHDFSRFSVWTIDSFFQRVIHNFTREMGLSAGFTIELDNKAILEEAIGTMMFDLDREPGLLQWLVAFSENRMEEGKTWNVAREIRLLGKELFREEFQSLGQDLLNKLKDHDFVNGCRQDLLRRKMEFENFIRKNGSEAMDLMTRFGLEPEDFKYVASGPGMYLMKAARGSVIPPGPRIRSCPDNPGNWYSAGSDRRESILGAYKAGLNGILTEIIAFFDKNYCTYSSVVQSLENIYSLGILAVLHSGIRDITRSRNIFLLSDSGKILKDIIGKNEAPFIYEKIGSRFLHYMIDEFQDTSHFQWSNFRPLVHNSLAENRMNLLVGDVKQSIYRWRNSDWKILGQEVMNDFHPSWIEQKPLDENRRSAKNIIAFNNSFFPRAVSCLDRVIREKVAGEAAGKGTGEGLAGLLQDAYRHILQKITPGTAGGGYVRLETIPHSTEKHWKTRLHEDFPGWLERVQDLGIRPEDTAILVRTKKEGRDLLEAVGTCLLEGKSRNGYIYNIVSNESLLLTSSAAVCLLLALFRFLIDPDDKLNRAFISYEYLHFSGADPRGPGQKEMDRGVAEPENILPGEFFRSTERLKLLSLYELAEHLVLLLGINDKPGEYPFVQAFLDVVLNYQHSRSSDLGSFLSWWDAGPADELSVQLPDHQRAFRLLTIHKAKGLQFDAVIIPYCAWDFEPLPQGTILWSKQGIEPFHQLDLVPVNYSGKLVSTLFERDYWLEKVNSYIDNLNLLYVAFTRARHCLFIAVPPAGANKRFHAGRVLLQALGENMDPPADHTCPTIDPELFSAYSEGVLEIGVPDPLARSLFTSAADPAEIRMPGIPVLPYHERLSLHSSSLDYYQLTGSEKGQRVNRGKVLHEIFERIRTAGDVGPATRQAVMEGKIGPSEAAALENEIKKMITQENVSDWFSGKWIVMAEKEILIPGGQTYRPDRVMVSGKKAVVLDYKFGMEKKNEYKRQVEKYCRLLEEMGYAGVEGWIWYLQLNETEAV